MKEKRNIRAFALMLALAAALAVFSAAEEAGSQGDPLVTLSYLNETFLPKILGQVDAKLGTGKSTGDAFTVVTLGRDQSLRLDIGCEVMLRVGSASCGADSAPGLIDETSGKTLEGGGALEKNHLYMATVEGRAVRAAADTVKVLVRGSYTVG